jgi:hypothetical protein
MRFEWDVAKNRANIWKHGFDFQDAEEMFLGVFLDWPDTREGYSEERWVGLGITRSRFAVVIVATPEPEVIRIIAEKGEP